MKVSLHRHPRILKTPVAVHNSSIPTISLLIGSTEPTATDSSWLWRTKKREAEATIVDRWLQPTFSRRWKICLQSDVFHSSQYPRAAIQWIVQVEDAKSIDYLITSRSMTGKPILVFENLDVKIASGLRKIQTRNFKKHFTTDKCKAQSEKGSLTGRHIAWMIHDLFKIRGEHGAILDFRDIQSFWGQT